MTAPHNKSVSADAQGRPRLRRFVLAVGASLAAAMAVAIMFVLFIVITAIAFSGSTGDAHSKFVNSLAPLGYFVIGAAFGACIVGIANSVIVEKGIWLAGMVAGALALGFAAALMPSLGEWLGRRAALAVGIAVKLVISR